MIVCVFSICSWCIEHICYGQRDLADDSIEFARKRYVELGKTADAIVIARVSSKTIFKDKSTTFTPVPAIFKDHLTIAETKFKPLLVLKGEFASEITVEHFSALPLTKGSVGGIPITFKFLSDRQEVRRGSRLILCDPEYLLFLKKALEERYTLMGDLNTSADSVRYLLPF